MYEYMLTTEDNPYNPFEDFDNWYRFDMDKGYDCCGYLARIAKVEDWFSDEERSKEYERAIKEIIKYDVLNVGYKMVSKAV